MENNNKNEMLEKEVLKVETPKRRSLDNILGDIKEATSFEEILKQNMGKFKF